MQSAFWVPPGSYPSTQALEHDAGDCPAPLTRLYAIAAAPAQPPIIEHHREPRAGFAFSGSKPASATTRERPLPFRGRLRARVSDPTPSLPEQSCAECSRYSVARGAAPLPNESPNSRKEVYCDRRQGLSHSLVAGSIPAPQSRELSTPPRCRRRARRWTSCRGCAASS